MVLLAFPYVYLHLAGMIQTFKYSKVRIFKLLAFCVTVTQCMILPHIHVCEILSAYFAVTL